VPFSASFVTHIDSRAKKKMKGWNFLQKTAVSISATGRTPRSPSTLTGPSCFAPVLFPQRDRGGKPPWQQVVPFPQELLPGIFLSVEKSPA